MSLTTDKAFILALRSNSELIAQLPAGDVYNTAIALPDEDLDNVPLPYIIVTFDGMANSALTKDDWEGDSDTVNIGIMVVAKTRPELGELTEAVRSTVKTYFNSATDEDENYDLIPNDYTLTADAVQYDWTKPCYWQSLKYQCDSNA